MPHYALPPVLFNTVYALNDVLPATARSAFQTDLFKRLELMPHPEQVNYDDTPGVDLMPVSAGIGHLDAITHWFLLGLLVDGTAGALQGVESDVERAIVFAVARLHLRWLSEDYPSDGEWTAIADEKTNPLPEAPSNACFTAWSLACIGTQDATLVKSALGFAATGWYGKRLRPPSPCQVLSPSMFGRLFDRALNWVAVRLGRGPTDPTANAIHYYWQVTWLLDLMNLRWLPTDAEEERLFRSVLRGKATAGPEYLKVLHRNKVEAEVVARTERTLKRLLDWRRTAGQKGPA